MATDDFERYKSDYELDFLIEVQEYSLDDYRQWELSWLKDDACSKPLELMTDDFKFTDFVEDIIWQEMQVSSNPQKKTS